MHLIRRAKVQPDNHFLSLWRELETANRSPQMVPGETAIPGRQTTQLPAAVAFTRIESQGPNAIRTDTVLNNKAVHYIFTIIGNVQPHQTLEAEYSLLEEQFPTR